MPRRDRTQQKEYPYHVTTRTNGKNFWLNKKTYKFFIEVFIDVVRKYGAHIHHLKLMSNHYHLILSTPNENISKIMWFINNQLAKKINRQMSTSGHFWGSRFCSAIIDKAEYLLNCIRYTYNNGVRCGMCATAQEDDQLSSFEFYARGKKIEFIVVEDQVYFTFGEDDRQRQENFRRMFDEPMPESTLEAVRKGIKRGFYGSEDFLSKMKAKYMS